MIRRNFTLGLIATLLASAPASAGDPIDWHYMYFKEARPLTLDTLRIAVWDPTPEAQRVDGRLYQIRQLQDRPENRGQLAGDMGSGWELLDVSGTPSGGSEEGIIALINEVATDPLTSAYASPVFIDGETVMIVLPQIQVRFEEGVPLSVVEQALAETGTGAIIESDWVIPGTYVVEGGSRSGIDVLNSANALALRGDTLWGDVNWRMTGGDFRQTRVEYPPLELATRRGPATAISPRQKAGACGPMSKNPPSDPLFLASWGLEQFNDIDVNATGAWAQCAGTNNVIVAVLDDGVERFHPDLAGRIIVGRDFTGQCNPDLPCQGEPQTSCDNHGTTVAGVINAAANGSTPQGGVGVAPGVTILPVRVAHYWQPTGGTACINQLDQYELAVGLAYSAENGADITNLSWNFLGDEISSTVAAIYKATHEAGLIHFNSAGNDFEPRIYIPGNLPVVHSVSGIDFLGELFFVNDGFASNFGPGIAFTGPGRFIITTDRTGDDGEAGSSSQYGADYVSITGTSYACPFVSGVAALIISTYPDLSPEEVYFMLRRSAQDLGDPGYDIKFGHGLPDAAMALNLASSYIFYSGFETGDTFDWSSNTGLSRREN